MGRHVKTLLTKHTLGQPKMRTLLLLVVLAAVCTAQETFQTRRQQFYDKIDGPVSVFSTTENYVYSPLAIRMMGGALMRGTKGKALRELADAFCYSPGDDENNPVDEGYLSLMKARFQGESNLRQSLFWTSPKYHNLNKEYGSAFKEPDGVGMILKRVKPSFNNKEKYLNGIVRKGTNGQIDEVFPQGHFMKTQPKLIILNSLFFDEKWHKQLMMQNMTKPQTFKNFSPGHGWSSEAQVEFFQNSEEAKKNYKLRYEMVREGELRGTKIVWIPFHPHDKRQPYMVIALPPENSYEPYLTNGDSRSSILNEISFSKIKSAYEISESKRKVNLQVPKFKFENTLPLGDIMKGLGVNEIFDETANALERMFNQPKGYYVSQAIHAATIDVNEIGAKASAITALQASSRSKPMNVIVNRPFKFFITNKRHSTLYFAGAVHKLT